MLRRRGSGQGLALCHEGAANRSKQRGRLPKPIISIHYLSLRVSLKPGNQPEESHLLYSGFFQLGAPVCCQRQSGCRDLLSRLPSELMQASMTTLMVSNVRMYGYNSQKSVLQKVRTI